MKKIIIALLLVTFKISFAQSAWVWQSPRPTGENLNDVKFLNSQKGFAAGNGGTIIKTEDAGASWSEIRFFPQPCLDRCISINPFSENSMNVIVEKYPYGEIYLVKTSNAGATYESTYITSGSSSPLTSFFVNQNTGYYFRDNITYRTVTGGAMWQRYSINNDSITTVKFLDAQTGWAVTTPYVNKLYKTTNAGTSWTFTSLPAGCMVNSLFFTDEYTGWVKSGSVGDRNIYRTDNGGISWYVQDWLFDFQSTVEFANQNNGCVFTNESIKFSSNGGFNWYPADVPADLTLNSLKFSDASTGCAVGKSGRILRTIDGGASWSYATIQYGDFSNINDISFANANTGWAAAGQGLLKTTDGGESWMMYAPSAEVIQHVKFLSATTGFMSYANTIAKTTDGGLKWQTTTHPGITFGDFCFPTTYTGTGYVSAKEGINFYVYKTTDAGTSWFPLGIPGGTSDLCLHFINSNTGYISYSNNTYKTNNGGQTWTSVFGAQAKSLFFTSEAIGFAGSTGISKTTDNGATWYNKWANPFLFTVDFTSIQFINQNTGWAFGGQAFNNNYEFGIILKTTNAGDNWTVCNNISTAFLSGDFINANTGWASGKNGAIIKTTTGGLTGAQQVSTSVPDKFYLQQNYPNPFNPNTNIEFSLPQNTFVRLKIFDMLGREIANLVNENLSAGKYKYDFNASALPSGIYFYKLETENFSETRKMMLIK